MKPRKRRSQLPAPKKRTPPARVQVRESPAVVTQFQVGTDGHRHTLTGQLAGSVAALPYVVAIVAMIAMVAVVALLR